ncbi:MAG TPA: sulfotransferase, partial [Acidimicrobiales bacterium]|nr:sulfotransferase [Acidimicrobiales bacterium]
MTPRATQTTSISPQPRVPAVFVMAPGRAGSTLLVRLLGAHPAVAVLPETAYFTALRRHGALSGFRNHAHFCLVAQTLWESLQSTDVVAANLLCDLMADETVDESDPVGLLSDLGAVYARTQGADIWGEKTPGASRFSGYISERLPGSRFIFLVRDPRDIVVSRVRSLRLQPLGPPGDPPASTERRQRLESLVRDSTVASRQLRMLRAAMQANPSSLSLSYEDLVRDPAQATKLICDYLDIPFVANLPDVLS